MLLLVPLSIETNAATPRAQLHIALSGAGRVTTPDGRIACGTRCSAGFPEGALVRLKAEDTHYFVFSSWRDGCIGTLRTCVVEAGSVSRVRAAFTRRAAELRLTVGGPGVVRSEPKGIVCGQGAGADQCDGDFGRGTTVTLIASPRSHASFDTWHGPCGDGRPRCAIFMSADRTATAGFASTLPASAGTIAVASGVRVVSVPAGIDCTRRCSATFPVGTRVVLHTAAIRSTSSFITWSGACAGEVPSCPIVAGTPTVVHVSKVGVFTPPVTGPPEFGVNVNVSGHGVVVGGGQINCGRRRATIRACQGYFSQGAHVVLRALPARGVRFAGWTGGFCYGTGRCRLTVDATKLVYATFGRHR